MRKTQRPTRKVSLGGEIRENLPYPYVYYPNHYGTFFMFGKDNCSQPVFCECAKPAIENYIRLKSLSKTHESSNPKRTPPRDIHFFPNLISDVSMQLSDIPRSILQFKKELCHRCHLTPPTMTYCLPMYGGQFMQSYGWYVNQAYLRLGINPKSFDFLPNVCPLEYQEQIIGVKSIHEKCIGMNIQAGKLLADQGDMEEILNDRRYVQRTYSQTSRRFTKNIENIVRGEFGLKRVGEGWVSETLLCHIVQRIYVGKEVIFHHRPHWLEGLELDIFVPQENLAFEYQGQQHYYAVDTWGGKKALEKLRLRDKKKVNLCKRNKIKLIRIKYSEPLSEDHIASRIAEK